MYSSEFDSNYFYSYVLISLDLVYSCYCYFNVQLLVTSLTKRTGVYSSNGNVNITYIINTFNIIHSRTRKTHNKNQSRATFMKNRGQGFKPLPMPFP